MPAAAAAMLKALGSEDAVTGAGRERILSMPCGLCDPPPPLDPAELVGLALPLPGLPKWFPAAP